MPKRAQAEYMRSYRLLCATCSARRSAAHPVDARTEALHQRQVLLCERQDIFSERLNAIDSRLHSVERKVDALAGSLAALTEIVLKRLPLPDGEL